MDFFNLKFKPLKTKSNDKKKEKKLTNIFI